MEFEARHPPAGAGNSGSSRGSRPESASDGGGPAHRNIRKDAEAGQVDKAKDKLITMMTSTKEVETSTLVSVLTALLKLGRLNDTVVLMSRARECCGDKRVLTADVVVRMLTHIPMRSGPESDLACSFVEHCTAITQFRGGCSAAEYFERQARALVRELHMPYFLVPLVALPPYVPPPG